MPSQMQGPFVARPKDEAIDNILSEGVAACEHLFASLDKDKAGVVTFASLQYHLTRFFFPDRERLSLLFKTLDDDDDGTLDFPQFLALIYLMRSEKGSLSAFWQQKQNVDVVADGFGKLEEAWVKYDAEKTRKMSYKDASSLISNDLPNLWESGQSKLESFFPTSERSVIPPPHAVSSDHCRTLIHCGKSKQTPLAAFQRGFWSLPEICACVAGPDCDASEVHALALYHPQRSPGQPHPRSGSWSPHASA